MTETKKNTSIFSKGINVLSEILKNPLCFAILCICVTAIVMSLIFSGMSFSDLAGDGKLKDEFDKVKTEVSGGFDKVNEKIDGVEKKVDDNTDEIKELRTLIINGFKKE